MKALFLCRIHDWISLAGHITTQKVIPAILKLVDIAGIVSASEGEGLGNKFLSHIRERVDAIMQVVRCFEDDDVIHVSGKVDPLDDIEIIEAELMLADIQTLENALNKAERTARSGDKEAKATVDVVQKCLAHLGEDKPLRSLGLYEAELKFIHSYGLLTLKPVLYVANVAEDDLNGEGELVQKVRDYTAEVNAGVVHVCARLEAEIAELDEEDREEMLESVGLTEPSLAVLAEKLTPRWAYKVISRPVKKKSERGRCLLGPPRFRRPV